VHLSNRNDASTAQSPVDRSLGTAKEGEMWVSRVRSAKSAQPKRPSARELKWERPMAQLVVSWFMYDGAIRVHAINAVGRRKGRIIEVEEVETGERIHGSARKLQRLADKLGRSSGELDREPAWTPDSTS
jgi:hypothetical protein